VLGEELMQQDQRGWILEHEARKKEEDLQDGEGEEIHESARGHDNARDHEVAPTNLRPYPSERIFHFLGLPT